MKTFLKTTAIRVTVVPLVAAGIAFAAVSALAGMATETSPRSDVFDVTESPGTTDPTPSPDPAPAAVVPVAPAPVEPPPAPAPVAEQEPAPAPEAAPAPEPVPAPQEAGELPEGWEAPKNPGEPPRDPVVVVPEAPCMPGEAC